MRAAVGCVACLTAMTSLSFAAPHNSFSTPALSGNYPVGAATWQIGDTSSWTEVKQAPWINPQLVKAGFVPFVHESKHYYCRVSHGPQIGSHVIERTFMCADTSTGGWLFRRNR
jgi:hypothetical protein